LAAQVWPDGVNGTTLTPGISALAKAHVSGSVRIQLNAMPALHPPGKRTVVVPRSAERDSRTLRICERAGSR
jgi:hypothetical protein